MSNAKTLALVLAALAPGPHGHGPPIMHAPKPPKSVETASAKDCEMFAAVAYQKMGWSTARSKWPLLTDVEEPKAIYRVDCPWGKFGLKAPTTASPSAPIVIMFLRPQYLAGGNIASVWTEGQQNRNSRSGPETWKQQFHVGKRNYGGGHIYWVVY